MVQAGEITEQLELELRKANHYTNEHWMNNCICEVLFRQVKCFTCKWDSAHYYESEAPCGWCEAASQISSNQTASAETMDVGLQIVHLKHHSEQGRCGKLMLFTVTIDSVGRHTLYTACPQYIWKWNCIYSAFSIWVNLNVQREKT